MQMKRIAGANAIDLAADVAGSPERQPVVLLHGGGQTRHSWGTLAHRLAASDYHVISLDLRGHGESDWAPDGDYTVDAFAADLRQVLTDLRQPPVLIGASLGGMTSLVVCGGAPAESIRGLVLVDVVPRVNQEGVARIRAFMRANLDGFASLEEAADAVAHYLPSRPQPSSPEGLRKNLRTGPDDRLYWHWDPAFVTGDQRPGTPQGIQQLRDAATCVDVPTLLIRGKASDVVDDAGVGDLLGLIPHAQAVDVAGAGHMVAGDRNDIFNDAVEGFLRDLPARGRTEQSTVREIDL